MPRVTHVAKAQQRYATVPVIDPETGQPKKTQVMRNGEPKMTRAKGTRPARPVFMAVTVQDKTRPKGLYTCDFCSKPIEIGTPYKHITPKSGPYGGRKRTRHEGCPNWQPWDYSNSLSAQIARIEHDFEQAIDSAESTDDIQSALDDAASSVEEIAGQKREGAENIEEGFGHPTSQSEELETMADDLDTWADEIKSADIPDVPECEECSSGEVDCSECNGTGEIDDVPEGDNPTCGVCNGNGQVECDNCDGTGEDIEAFRDQVRDQVTVVAECPV